MSTENMKWSDLYSIAVELGEEGRHIDAKIVWRVAIVARPHSTMLHGEFGDYLSENDDPDAESVYREGLKKSRDFKCMCGLSRLLFKQRKIREAVTLVQRALEVEESVDLYCLLGDCFTEINDPEDASNCYRLALDLDQHSAAAHRSLAKVLNQMGQYQEASKHYDRAKQLANQGGGPAGP